MDINSCACDGVCGRQHTGPCHNRLGLRATCARYPTRLRLVDGRVFCVKKIVELEARKLSLSAAVQALSDQERDAKKRVESLKGYDQLRRIEDFLAGKITHYVIWDGYNDLPIPRVSALEDERCGDEKSPREPLKLLALYGSKDRTMEWKLSYYSDGSGGRGSHCIPCCSREEAIEKAKAILADSFKKYQRPASGGVWAADELVKAAKALDAPIPEGFEVWLREHHIRGLEAEVRSCEKKRDEWQQRIDALNGRGA